MSLQTVIQTLFPPQCLLCEAWVAEQGGLCPACFADAEFLTGLTCDSCARPLPGHREDDSPVQCDICLDHAPVWGRARAMLRYAGRGKDLVMMFKHADRTDIAPGAAKMLMRHAGDVITPGVRLVPVPLHWRRMVKRRYNQSALLAQALAGISGGRFVPDALRRPKATRALGAFKADERHAELEGAIALHDARAIAGRRVVIVDDVYTTGATLTACAERVLEGGALSVDVVVLARVAPKA